MSLIDTTTVDYFTDLLKKSTSQFEGKASTSILGYADKVMAKNHLPTFSELHNISTTAYQNVMKNADWNSNFNESFSPDVSGSINNFLAPGTSVAKSNNDKNNPSSAPVKGPVNVPTVSLRYPLPGGDDTEKVPYMEIRGFKYQYSDTDYLGNRIASKDPVTQKPLPATERTATIKLPLPGNLASALELDFDDYSSVFAKLIKAGNGMQLDPEGIGKAIGAVGGRISDADAWGTAGMVGAAAGVFSGTAGGATLGEAAGVAFSEALNYIRVAAGIAVNPMQQASYVGSKIRHHAFEFNLVPRNQAEAIEVKKIIQTLQYHSIGARIAEVGGILTDYPSVWNVTFHTQDGTHINGILSIPDAFLTNVNVTYSPTRAGFTVTRDNDPFAYVLSIVFKESQNLIRDDLWYIRQGEKLLENSQPRVPQLKKGDTGKNITAWVDAANSVADKIVDAVTPDAEPTPNKTNDEKQVNKLKALSEKTGNQKANNQKNGGGKPSQFPQRPTAKQAEKTAREAITPTPPANKTGNNNGFGGRP